MQLKNKNIITDPKSHVNTQEKNKIGFKNYFVRGAKFEHVNNDHWLYWLY